MSPEHLILVVYSTPIPTRYGASLGDQLALCSISPMAGEAVPAVPTDPQLASQFLGGCRQHVVVVNVACVGEASEGFSTLALGRVWRVHDLVPCAEYYCRDVFVSRPTRRRKTVVLGAVGARWTLVESTFI